MIPRSAHFHKPILQAVAAWLLALLAIAALALTAPACDAAPAAGPDAGAAACVELPAGRVGGVRNPQVGDFALVKVDRYVRSELGSDYRLLFETPADLDTTTVGFSFRNDALHRDIIFLEGGGRGVRNYLPRRNLCWGLDGLLAHPYARRTLVVEADRE